MDQFYTLTQHSQRIQTYITKLSYVEFRKYFTFGIVACFSAWLFVLWQSADILTIQGKRWYLLGCGISIFLSYIAMDIYVQNVLRNVIGVVLSAVVYPNVLRFIMWRLPMVSIDAMLLTGFFVSQTMLVALWCYTKNWSLCGHMAKQCGLWSTIKFCCMRTLREHQLRRDIRKWDKTAIQTKGTLPQICPKSWLNSPFEERIQQIQCVVEHEIAVLNLSDTVTIVARSYGRVPYWEFDCYVNFERNRIVWESEAVEWHHPYEILADLLLALQQIKWYQLQDATTQQIISVEHMQETEEGETLSSRSDSKTATLLFEQFKGDHTMLVYDILTGSYARARSDWYCGF